MHISSCYAKILGETNFRTQEIPRSGSKAKDREREKRKKERKRLNDGDNNGQATQARMAHASRLGQKVTNVLEVKLFQCLCWDGIIAV